ncbi:MAG: cysteine-rich CWC family protein [Limnohabitans sp.]
MTTPSLSGPIDPSRCPLCGGPNACAMTCAEPPTGCWCVSQTFSPSLLARVPVHSQRMACICARCVAADAAPPTTAPDSPT